MGAGAGAGGGVELSWTQATGAGAKRAVGWMDLGREVPGACVRCDAEIGRAHV